MPDASNDPVVARAAFAQAIRDGLGLPDYRLRAQTRQERRVRRRLQKGRDPNLALATLAVQQFWDGDIDKATARARLLQELHAVKPSRVLAAGYEAVSRVLDDMDGARTSESATLATYLKYAVDTDPRARMRRDSYGLGEARGHVFVREMAGRYQKLSEPERADVEERLRAFVGDYPWNTLAAEIREQTWWSETGVNLDPKNNGLRESYERIHASARTERSHTARSLALGWYNNTKHEL